MHEKVKAYFEDLRPKQKEICEKVREIMFKTFPDLDESFKNGAPWYECKYYIAGFKDHVNIGFSVKGLNEEELSLFQGNGKYMRHIKLYSIDDIDEDEIVKRLKVVKKVAEI